VRAGLQGVVHAFDEGVPVGPHRFDLLGPAPASLPVRLDVDPEVAQGPLGLTQAVPQGPHLGGEGVEQGEEPIVDGVGQGLVPVVTEAVTDLIDGVVIDGVVIDGVVIDGVVINGLVVDCRRRGHRTP
jgi:hypothetical protein